MFRTYKLILGRHGESILNSQNRFSGWIDTPLNKKGILQSFYMGQKLLNNHLIPNIIFTSKLIRTIQTSSIIQHFLKKDIQTISSWNLNERHYGILEGKNRDEEIKEYGFENIDAIRNDFCAMPYFFDNKYIYDTNHLINNDTLAGLESGVAVTGIIDGRVISCGGLIPYHHGNAELWQIPSIYVKENFMIYGKYIKKWLEDQRLIFQIRRMETICLPDELHDKWMSFLGFECEGTKKKWIYDIDYKMWGKVWE